VASATIAEISYHVFHYDIDKAHNHKQNLPQASVSPIKKKSIQKWDSYNDIVPRLRNSIPEDSAAVISDR